MRDSKVAIIAILTAFLAITVIDLQALLVSSSAVLLSALFLFLLKKRALKDSNVENRGESGDLKSSVELLEANYVESTLFGFTSTLEKKIDESLTFLASNEREKLSQVNKFEPTTILFAALHSLLLLLIISLDSRGWSQLEIVVLVVSPIVIHRSLQAIFEKSKRSIT
jgi:hypothetical protein